MGRQSEQNSNFISCLSGKVKIHPTPPLTTRSQKTATWLCKVTKSSVKPNINVSPGLALICSTNPIRNLRDQVVLIHNQLEISVNINRFTQSLHSVFYFSCDKCFSVLISPKQSGQNDSKRKEISTYIMLYLNLQKCWL